MSNLVKYVRKAEIAKSLSIGTTTLVRWQDEGRIVLPEPFRPTKAAALYEIEAVNQAIAEMVSLEKTRAVAA